MNHNGITDFNSVNNSVEFANYAKLLRLVLEEGTKKIKEYVLCHLPGGLSLDNALMQKKAEIENLKRRNIINGKQFKQLYPKTHRVNIESFDLTLLYILVRNVAENVPRINFSRFENQGIHKHDTLPQHDVIRIRNLRNELAHNTSLQTDESTFQIQWHEIESALKRLGSDETVIKNYKTRDLDPMKAANHYLNSIKPVLIELKSRYNTEKRKTIVLSYAAILSLLLPSLALAVAVLALNHKHEVKAFCICNMETLYSSQVAGAIRYISRDGWHAQKSQGPTTKITRYPLNNVIITDSVVSSRCITTEDCCKHAQFVQNVSFHWNFSDVAVNYMVGNDGIIYEGRGSGIEPTILKHYDNATLAIAFMGTYIHTAPSDESVAALQHYLQYLVDQT